MHLLRLFLMAWLSLGILTVFLLFWLCKRTAATVSKGTGRPIFPPQRANLGGDNSSGQARAA